VRRALIPRRGRRGLLARGYRRAVRTSVQAGLEIRAAHRDDASAISKLLTELGHPLEPALAVTQIARIQALAPNYAVFVAVKDGAVIGLVSALSTPGLH